MASLALSYASKTATNDLLSLFSALIGVCPEMQRFPVTSRTEYDPTHSTHELAELLAIQRNIYCLQ